jgi:hypothetical protein
VTAATSKSSTGVGAVKAELINLREHIGDQHKIGWDPAYFAEHGPTATADDPWLQIIPGRHGHIFPFGGEMLAVSTDLRGPEQQGGRRGE